MPKRSGRPTPARPLDPPVTDVHWKAMANTICANASVSIRKKIPAVRTTSAPMTSARRAALAAAAASVTASSLVARRWLAIPAAYAPAPKNAAWPSEGIPAKPTRRSSESAKIAKTRMSRRTVVANRDDSHPALQYGKATRPAAATAIASQVATRLIARPECVREDPSA